MKSHAICWRRGSHILANYPRQWKQPFLPLSLPAYRHYSHLSSGTHTSQREYTHPVDQDTIVTSIKSQKNSSKIVLTKKERFQLLRFEAIKKWIFRYATPKTIYNSVLKGLAIFSPNTPPSMVVFTPFKLKPSHSPLHADNTISEPIFIMASNYGDGLGLDSHGWIHVIKGANVGDTVTAKRMISIEGLVKCHVVDVVKRASIPLPKTSSEDTLSPLQSTLLNGHWARSTPPCKHFHNCYGCQFQHVTYWAELEEKRKFVSDLLLDRASELGMTQEMVLSCTKSIRGKVHASKRKMNSEMNLYGYKKSLEVLVPQVSTNHTLDRLSISSTPPFQSEAPDIERCELVTPLLNQAFASLRENWIGQENIGDFPVHPQQIELKETLLVPKNTTLSASQLVFAQRQHAKALRRSKILANKAGKPLAGPKTLDESLAAAGLSWEKRVIGRNARTVTQVNDATFIIPVRSKIPNDELMATIVTMFITRLAPLKQKLQSPLNNLVVPFAGYGLYPIVMSHLFSNIFALYRNPSSERELLENVYLNRRRHVLTCGHLNIDDGPVDIKAGINRLASSIPKDTNKPLETNPDDTIVVLEPGKTGLTSNALANILRYRPRVIYYISSIISQQLWDIQYFTGGGSIGRKTCSKMKRILSFVDPLYASSQAIRECMRLTKNKRKVFSRKGNWAPSSDQDSNDSNSSTVYEVEHFRVIDSGPRTKNVNVIYTLIRKD